MLHNLISLYKPRAAIWNIAGDPTLHCMYCVRYDRKVIIQIVLQY